MNGISALKKNELKPRNLSNLPKVIQLVHQSWGLKPDHLDFESHALFTTQESYYAWSIIIMYKMLLMGEKFLANGKTFVVRVCLILIPWYIIVILERQYFFSDLSHDYSVYTIEDGNLKFSQWSTMKKIIYKMDNFITNISA